MTSAEIIQLVVSGLTVGSIYALVGLGFNLIFNSTDVINFAQGEFVMVGGILAAVAIGEMVTIRDQDHVDLVAHTFATAPIEIGERSWIGAKATILRGVSVGAEAVVGAHAVVTREVEAGARVAGVPAEPISPR